MHLVEHGGRLRGQAVQLLIEIRLADGQQPNVPVAWHQIRRMRPNIAIRKVNTNYLTRAVVASRKVMST